MTVAWDFHAQLQLTGDFALPQSINYLQAFREQALAGLASHPWPTRKTEAWKYTPLTTLENPAFLKNTAVTLTEQLTPDSEKASPDCIELHCIDGHWVTQSIDPVGSVMITRFCMATREQQALIQRYLGSTCPTGQSLFADLNSAAFQDGMLIHVAAHQQLTKPVRIVFRSLTSTLPDAVHGRVLVVMEAGSQMTLIEEFDSVGDPLSRLHNQVTEICLGANARLTHLRLEAGTHSPLLINRLQVDQSRDSQYEHHSLTLGNTFKRNELCIRLKESAATTRLSGIWLGKARHHLEHQINIEHLAPHCSSATAYKGWLDEESRAVFNGRIYIHKGAAKTQAHLSNQNLLLSNTAEVDTKPELEIYNDDVQCSHGATIGRLDENAVFYFRSRGISQAVAEAMLGFGFINEMILQIPVPAVQAEATRQVTNFLHDIDALRNLWAN